jgi:hypothetical protein
MNNQAVVPAGNATGLRISQAVFVFMIVALLIGTFLRVSLLIGYPVVILFLCLFLKVRVSLELLLLLMLVALSLILSMFNGWFFRYKLLSLYFMLPFLLLLFSTIPIRKFTEVNHVKSFFKCLTVVAAINDVFGLIQIIRSSNSDDSFMGIFSGFSLAHNGLVIINAVVAFYYFAIFIGKKQKKNLAFAIIFAVCSVLGFYGAGLVVLLLTLILGFFKLRLRAILKTALICIVSLITIYYLLLYIKPNVLHYNLANLKKIATFDIQHGPRKVIMHYNYIRSYPTDFKDFLFGSGPGTFNSRSAFMVGSPSYFSGGKIIKSDAKPYYFKNYAYPLWNETNTSQALYLDGFRNQPFSSLLAFLGEYGLIFTICFGILYYRMYRKVAVKAKLGQNSINGYFFLFKLLMILLPLLLCIDNFYEFPEIMILILLPLKLLEREISKGALPADLQRD